MQPTASAAPAGYLEPTFGQRILARLVDGVCFVPVIFLAYQLVDSPGVRFLVLGVAGLAYEVGFTIAWAGQTPGKRALGIRIIAVDGTLSSGRLVIRALVPHVANVPGPLGGLLAIVVFAPILRRPLHRGLHDHAAGTVVTSLEPRHPSVTC
jgi:uncharacterized RDD family membrane protein YckC